MRELKFRGWSLSDKKMYEPVWFDNLEVTWFDKANNEWTVLGDRWPNTMLHQVIVEQYTGLKDSKGVEIYEGDCLGDIYDSLHIRWCEWCGGFQMFFKDECYCCSGEIHWQEVVADPWKVVIGNIHEPPIDEARENS